MVYSHPSLRETKNNLVDQTIMIMISKVCVLFALLVYASAQVIPTPTFSGGPGIPTNSQNNFGNYPNTAGTVTSNGLDPLTLLFLTRGEGGFRRYLPFLLSQQNGMNGGGIPYYLLLAGLNN
ncbi:hypothetical protein LOTGIDRAFT_231124 [Lottia gigantea]|uniref:Uncharacterized protein n=1 Tax=Lottia gigantea TaxID=225164 RepID=V4B0E5_LOTGI|nr:hypothetical protein LOTGIDRAFT_231124 [Lottia gigantea]ESO99541.1 hypothetical protein LOTGIDRAFT_231124 [Lottia gigantea]